jgi:hypothetical protein
METYIRQLYVFIFVFNTSEASEFITEQYSLCTVDIYDVSPMVSGKESTGSEGAVENTNCLQEEHLHTICF